MKQWAVAGAAACAVMLVVACASAPRAGVSSATQPLTIELFDSRAFTVPPFPEPALALALPELPAAPVAKVAPVTPIPASAALEAAAREQPRTMQLDESLRSPARPAAKASFRLEPPTLPPAVAAARPVSASTPAPAPAKPSSAKPAAAKAAPSPAPASAPAAKPVASAPVPGAPAPSAGGAGSAAVGASAPAPSAAGAAPYGRLREIYARQGDELQIGLDGVGFLWLGLADSQADGMSFKSKENRANRTLFTFQALKLGTYDLDFLQQDNMAGKSSRETVRVHVVSDQDFAAATAGQPVDPGSAAAASAETGDPAFAQKLAAAGSYPAAVAELLKGYREGNPALNDQIAALYLRMGSYDAAEKYWGRNLQPQTDFTARAVVGLFRVSVLQDDQPGLLSYLRPFLALSDPSMEEPLVQAVRMEKRRSEIGMALDLAGEYSRRFPGGSWRDEVDFLTAQLLEADSQFRDIVRARQLYQAIVTDHPESPYADSARARVQYIDRHFLQVR